MFAAAIIVIALMVMSQISKGSHERDLQLAHAQEHHKDMDKAYISLIRVIFYILHDNSYLSLEYNNTEFLESILL